MAIIDKYEKYIQLLEANKNLILTGAPGTGKTFMAKEIAWGLIDSVVIKHRHLDSFFEKLWSDPNELGDIVENQTTMVQFHPSYDYSDFVEGLRPIKNTESQLEFERIDGVFKEFCKKSCSGAIMLKKKREAVSKDNTNKKRIQGWLGIDDTFNDSIFVVNLRVLYKSCYEAVIREIDEGGYAWLFYQNKENIPSGEIKHLQSFAVESDYRDFEWHNIIDKDTNWADDIEFSYNLFSIFFKTCINVFEGTCPSEDEIKKEILTLWASVPDSPYKQRNYNLNISSSISTLNDVASFYHALFFWMIFYVKHNFELAYFPAIFIIDEINRGEISKIFGELFYSIDPGYRGKKGLVQTQYQNMIEDDDIFKNGFYVPENVYIIGTMNDIDRSVESMDFAMRRRFAFAEVSAAESYQNMIEDSKEFSDEEKVEIKERMFALNNAILKPELRLGEAYQIGAAYFRKYLDYKHLGAEQAFTVLWNNHLKGLLFEYLRGNQNAKAHLDELEKAYNKKGKTDDETDKNNG